MNNNNNIKIQNKTGFLLSSNSLCVWVCVCVFYCGEISFKVEKKRGGIKIEKRKFGKNEERVYTLNVFSLGLKNNL